MNTAKGLPRKFLLIKPASLKLMPRPSPVHVIQSLRNMIEHKSNPWLLWDPVSEVEVDFDYLFFRLYNRIVSCVKPFSSAYNSLAKYLSDTGNTLETRILTESYKSWLTTFQKLLIIITIIIIIITLLVRVARNGHGLINVWPWNLITNQIESNQILVFDERGKQEYPEKKLLGAE